MGTFNTKIEFGYDHKIQNTVIVDGGNKTPTELIKYYGRIYLHEKVEKFSILKNNEVSIVYCCYGVESKLPYNVRISDV